MFEFYEKRKVKRLLYTWPVVVFLCIPVGYLVSVAWSAYAKERETSANTIAATTELEKLKLREVALQTELERLSTERGIEEEIREKFEVGKPGEHAIVIVDKDQEKGHDLPPIKAKGLFEKIRKKFGW